MVRLGGLSADILDLMRPRFNSSMVRLGEIFVIRISDHVCEFQFQYGAIRRTLLRL